MPALTSSPSTTPRGARDEWETPPELFAAINARFHFTLDVAASDRNHKTARYFTSETPEGGGLNQSWQHEVVWCNPPYSEYATWLWKAHRETRVIKDARATVVLLLPVVTDTRAFHVWVARANALWFIKGRVRFLSPEGPAKNSPNFASMLAIFRDGGQWINQQVEWFDPHRGGLMH